LVLYKIPNIKTQTKYLYPFSTIQQKTLE